MIKTTLRAVAELEVAAYDFPQLRKISNTIVRFRNVWGINVACLHHCDAGKARRRATLLILRQFRRLFPAILVLISYLLRRTTIAFRSWRPIRLYREQRDRKRSAQRRANDASNQHLHCFQYRAITLPLQCYSGGEFLV